MTDVPGPEGAWSITLGLPIDALRPSSPPGRLDAPTPRGTGRGRGAGLVFVGLESRLAGAAVGTKG